MQSLFCHKALRPRTCVPALFHAYLTQAQQHAMSVLSLDIQVYDAH